MLDVIEAHNVVLKLQGKPFFQTQGDEWSIPPRILPDYDLFICFEGEGNFAIDGVPYILTPGYALLAPPGKEIQAVKKSQQKLKMVAQHFELRLFNNVDFFSRIEYKPLAALPEWNEVRRTLRKIKSLHDCDGHTWRIHALMLDIIYRFIESAYISSRSSGNKHLEIIIRIMEEMKKIPSDRESLKKAFSHSPYGYSHTANFFKNYTNDSPKRYLLSQRLEKAKEILAGGASVKEASLRTGFDDQLYFSRIFKKKTGISPTMYRSNIYS